MSIKIIVEKHKDRYTTYVEGLEGIVVGEGDTLKEALADVQSAICFHLETFGWLEKRIDDDELTEEDIKDIEEACADIAAGKFHTAEDVYRELGLMGKKKVK